MNNKIISLESKKYELKLNNFNNTEIVTLLDIKYKTLDNALFKLKRKLKKELNKIEVF